MGWELWRARRACRKRLLSRAILMLLILDGINLLPVLPLDGGWIMHAILFFRRPFLEAPTFV